MKKLIWVGLVALLLLSLVSACDQSIDPVDKGAAPGGATSARFEKGNEYVQSGMAFIASGDVDKATEEFNKAIVEFEAVVKADPSQVSARTNLGVAYYNVGRLDDAIGQYEKALEIAPDDADIHSNLAAAYVQKAQTGGTQLDTAQLDRATAEYKKAIEINPELSQAYFGLGVISLALGKNDDARQAFENFITYDDGKDTTATEQAKQYLEQLKNQ